MCSLGMFYPSIHSIGFAHPLTPLSITTGGITTFTLETRRSTKDSGHPETLLNDRSKSGHSADRNVLSHCSSSQVQRQLCQILTHTNSLFYPWSYRGAAEERTNLPSQMIMNMLEVHSTVLFLPILPCIPLRIFLVLGWLKSSFKFFCMFSWKNPNEPVG